jgi:hypothetical protein
MSPRSFVPRKPVKAKIDKDQVRKVIVEAQKTRAELEKDYREQSLKIHPWVCARCGREFTNRNLHELTVHHKDHNHNNNPPDGSNWENLCLYCHDNEHRRYHDHVEAGGVEVGEEQNQSLKHNPFGALKGLMKDGED